MCMHICKENQHQPLMSQFYDNPLFGFVYVAQPTVLRNTCRPARVFSTESFTRQVLTHQLHQHYFVVFALYGRVAAKAAQPSTLINLIKKRRELVFMDMCKICGYTRKQIVFTDSSTKKKNVDPG